MKAIVLKVFVGLFVAFAAYCPHFFGAVGLWLVGRRKEPVRDLFWTARNVSPVVLLLCTIISLVFFLPTR
jgi:hypothetical protein